MVERAPALQDAPRAMVYHWSTLDGLAPARPVLDDAHVGRASSSRTMPIGFETHGEIIAYGLACPERQGRATVQPASGAGCARQSHPRELDTFANARVLWDHEVTGHRSGRVGVTVSRAHDGDTVLRVAVAGRSGRCAARPFDARWTSASTA